MSTQIPEAYSHLKLSVLPQEFQYALLSEAQSRAPELASRVATLQSGGNPFFLFSGFGEVSFLTLKGAEGDLEPKKIESGWRAFKIIGDMPFGSVQGLIAHLSALLKEKGIGICVVSTFLTDYFFIRDQYLEQTKSALESAGWKLE